MGEGRGIKYKWKEQEEFSHNDEGQFYEVCAYSIFLMLLFYYYYTNTKIYRLICVISHQGKVVQEVLAFSI